MAFFFISTGQMGGAGGSPAGERGSPACAGHPAAVPDRQAPPPSLEIDAIPISIDWASLKLRAVHL